MVVLIWEQFNCLQCKSQTITVFRASIPDSTHTPYCQTRNLFSNLNDDYSELNLLYGFGGKVYIFLQLQCRQENSFLV